VQRRSPQPVYLYISSDRIELRDARDLWGLDCFATQDLIKARHPGQKVEMLTIGPAGEKLVRYACIISRRDHAAGRTGMGAVMGSKNLKAIVIARQANSAQPKAPAASRQAVRDYVAQIKQAADFKFFARYGSSGYVKWADDHGLIAAHNYREQRFAHVDKIDGRHLAKHVVKSSGCYRCPLQCKAEMQFKGAKPATAKAIRPEFEPMINLGAKCGLTDLEALVRLDNLCSRLGLDSTSTAANLAFAMELYECGLIGSKLLDGLDLTWGNAAAMEALIEQIANRKGLGALLARGVKHAAAAIGNGAAQFAVQVKGLELSAYHPGALLGTALGYAVSSRGGDYNNIYAALEYNWSPEQAAQAFGTTDAVDPQRPDGKGALVRRAVLVNIVLDSLGLCKVPALSLLGTYDLAAEARLTRAVASIPFEADDLFAAAERIAALEKMFNLRHGGGSDQLPDRFIDPEHALNPASFALMLQEYYDAMGWDEQGKPLVTTLHRLGIDKICS
jgi:aldehyde:ferredoxin oxidoreductase